jgi:hypothetical protein
VPCGCLQDRTAGVHRVLELLVTFGSLLVPEGDAIDRPDAPDGPKEMRVGSIGLYQGSDSVLERRITHPNCDRGAPNGDCVPRVLSGLDRIVELD